MIRKSWNNIKWMLTSQVEHARLAALIAASWNFADGKPREEVFQAIRRHDDGWKPADESPDIDGHCFPMDFDEMPLDRSTELWLASIEALEKEGNDYGAALVAGHFLDLARNKADMARASTKAARAAGTFIAKAKAVGTRCMKRHAEKTSQDQSLADEIFRKDLRFLQVCDYLSLLLCSDFIGETEIEDVPFLNGESALKVSRKAESLSLQISPLPFKKNLRDHLSSVCIPKQAYDSVEELQSAFRDCKPANNEVHFGAG